MVERGYLRINVGKRDRTRLTTPRLQGLSSLPSIEAAASRTLN